MRTRLTYSTLVAILVAVWIGLPRLPGVRGEEPGVAGPELAAPEPLPTTPALVTIPPSPEPRSPISGRYRGPATPEPVPRLAEPDVGGRPTIIEGRISVPAQRPVTAPRGEMTQSGDWDGPGTMAQPDRVDGSRPPPTPATGGVPLGPISPMPKPPAPPEKAAAGKGWLNRLNPLGPREKAPAGLRSPLNRPSALSLGLSGRGNGGASANGSSKGQGDEPESAPAKPRRPRGELRQRTAARPEPHPSPEPRG